MLSKNLPFKKIWILPVRILLDAIAAWKGLLTGDGGYFIAIIKAHLAFVKWCFFIQKKSLFPVLNKGPLYGVLQKNLIWHIFYKKEKNLFRNCQ